MHGKNPAWACLSVENVETKTILASNSVYSYSSLPRLDSPPRNAHSTFQQRKDVLVYCSGDWLLFEYAIGLRSPCAERPAKVDCGRNHPC
jgi:hypothetical protein